MPYMNIYGHLLPGAEEAAAGLLDAYLVRAAPPGRLTLRRSPLRRGTNRAHELHDLPHHVDR